LQSLGQMRAVVRSCSELRVFEPIT
jgi:hypothetical protein